MWSLFPQISSANSQESVRLLVGKEYIVGRKDCAVLIKDDPSISRKHAVITVQHDMANLGDPSKLPEVMLKDTSKYGVSVNGVKITQPTRLNSGDEILFGNHHSCYRLTYTPLVVVTSCLDNTKKKPLKKQIHLLGGHLLNDWKSGSVTHLVMDGLLFTIKVIHALAECCPIVKPNMFDDINTSSALLAPDMFLPPLKEDSIKSDGPLFLPDSRRKTLFSGKTFIFLSSKQYKRTYTAVEMCGGKTLLKDSVTNNVEDKRLFVKDGCCVMMVDQKERESYSIDMKQWITQIMDWMKSHNKRPIPESELGLAILKMTLTNYCNPDFDAVPVLTQSIVCQSLNVGLDEMSQVFSPQHKAHPYQNTLKKPRNTSKEDDDGKSPEIMFLGTTVSKPSSTTSTAAEQHHVFSGRGTRKAKTNQHKGVVSETQDYTPKGGNPKPDTKTSPISETLNISNKETIVLAEETPVRETKANRRPDTKISPIPETLNISGKDTNILAEETPVREGKVPRRPDTITSPMPDTLNVSIKDTDSVQTSSKDTKEASLWFPSTEKTKVAIPESEGLNYSKAKAKRGLNENNNEKTDGKINEMLVEKESTSNHKGGFIPDSMEMDDSPVSSRNEFHSSLSPQDLKKDPEWRPVKRTRVLDSTGGTERANEVIPTKRARNESVFGSPQQAMSTEGYYHDEEKGNFEEEYHDIKGQVLGNVDHFNANGDESQLCSVSKPEERVDGFLSKKVTGKGIQLSPKVEVEDDGLPRNLVVVDVVSLLVRPKLQQAAAPTQVTGKNFKKFRKQWYAGCERRFPKIIGGSDLVVHQTISGLDQEDWYIEAREANKEQDRRDKMEEELFMSDAGLPRGRKRR